MSPISIGRASSVAAAQEAVRTEKRVGFVLQRDPEKNELKPDDLHWVGTAGQVVRYVTNEGNHHLVVQGQSRFRVLEFLDGWPFLVARVALVEDIGRHHTGNRSPLPAIEGTRHRGSPVAA